MRQLKIFNYRKPSVLVSLEFTHSERSRGESFRRFLTRPVTSYL